MRPDYIGGGEASNGPITAANNVTITGGIELGPNQSSAIFTNNGSSNPPITRLTQPLVLDAYARQRATGSFILVDEASHRTVAAGMIDGAP